MLTPPFADFEMRVTEKTLLPHLEKIIKTPYPMPAVAEKLFDLGYDIFDSVFRDNGGIFLYRGHKCGL
jgi:hypothetical protein